MTSQITIDSVFHDGVNILSSNVTNNELDMTKEIQAKDHPYALPLRFPTKGSIAADQMAFNPNDISGIPINEDLLRSEKEMSGNFIGTQDLKEALGFMRSKSKSVQRNEQEPTLNEENNKKNLPKLNINPIITPTLKDPFSPRNVNMHTSLSSNLKGTNSNTVTSDMSSLKKFDFPGRG